MAIWTCNSNQCQPRATMGGDLAPNLGGTKKFFAAQFQENVHFQGKNFWWLSFSHRLGSSDFPFLFSHFPYVYYVKCCIWPFPHKKNHYFRKEFLDDTFFYSVRTFARIRQHCRLLKILGGPMHGPSPPPQILGGGPSPPFPLGLRPCIRAPKCLVKAILFLWSTVCLS